MVLANGEMVSASRDGRPALFCAARGTVGTLGIVIMLVINLIPAKRYVHTFQQRINSVDYGVTVVRR